MSVVEVVEVDGASGAWGAWGASGACAKAERGDDMTKLRLSNKIVKSFLSFKFIDSFNC